MKFAKQISPLLYKCIKLRFKITDYVVVVLIKFDENRKTKIEKFEEKQKTKFVFLRIFEVGEKTLPSPAKLHRFPFDFARVFGVKTLLQL